MRQSSERSLDSEALIIIFSMAELLLVTFIQKTGRKGTLGYKLYRFFSFFCILISFIGYKTLGFFKQAISKLLYSNSFNLHKSNFCPLHWECTSIYCLISYPFRS